MQRLSTAMMQDKPSLAARVAPALTLVALAPLIAEVLPGATRLSSIFVFPVEMAVWGVGALIIRAAVRRYRLGWRNLLLLALALAVAEECLIQQTSFAPLVIQLVKGEPYARAFGVNWLYLLWALAYESVLVVVVPVALAELIFRRRRDAVWLSRGGLLVALPVFVLGCFLAWFSWTQIARTKVFHLPPYTPPATAATIAVAILILLIVVALGPTRAALARPSRPLAPPRPIFAGLMALVPPVLWYGLMLLAFRIRPQIPPAPAAAAGLVLVIAALAVVPRWAAHPDWTDRHRYAAVLGTMLGSMAVGQAGFIGAAALDALGKIALDAIAVVLMIWLGLRRPAAVRPPTNDAAVRPPSNDAAD